LENKILVKAFVDWTWKTWGWCLHLPIGFFFRLWHQLTAVLQRYVKHEHFKQVNKQCSTH